MVHIEESISIPKDARSIYNLLKKMSYFPKFMKDIKNIDCKKSNRNIMISDWNINIDGATIKWREQDIYNDASKTVIFKMLEGDYAKYEGVWRAIDITNRAKLTFIVDIDWGAPAFVKFVEPILKRKTRRSIRSMLLAIKKRFVTGK